MAWTKRQFIEQAFDEIGLGAYVFDLDPQQIESALRRLDSMMGTWMDKGIQIGYPLPSEQKDSDPDELTSVPSPCNEAIYLNLAIRIAPGFGKTLMPETKASAKNAYDGLLARAAFPREQQLPSTTRQQAMANLRQPIRSRTGRKPDPIDRQQSTRLHRVRIWPSVDSRIWGKLQTPFRSR